MGFEHRGPCDPKPARTLGPLRKTRAFGLFRSVLTRDSTLKSWTPVDYHDVQPYLMAEIYTHVDDVFITTALSSLGM